MFMHCITKEGREKMRDLNIITVSGTVNREPTYKENKENSNKTILYYSLEIYTGRDYYPDKEKKELVHEKIYLNCVNYGKLAMELVNKVKKGSYVQVSGELRPNNYDRADGGKVYGLKIMANTCIPINQPEQQNNNQNTQKQNQKDSRGSLTMQILRSRNQETLIEDSILRCKGRTQLKQVQVYRLKKELQCQWHKK